MSWLFSQALAAEYSAGTSLDGEQFAPLSVMPTPHKFWRNDKTMEHSELSRFGLMCAALTETHGVELLMSFLAAFPARTFPVPAKALESTESDQDFGSKWQESSVRFDPAMSCWRTHLCLWEEVLPWSSVTLPKWGLMLSGVVFQHQSAERPIVGTESGLLPTPRASMGSHGIAWIRARTGEHRYNLEDYLGWQHLEAGGEEVPGLNVCPSYAEWLMMWPSGWTDLKPLEMDKFRGWQQQHSISLEEPTNEQ
ncbi:hypothetical protein HA51_23930 [Pantoea rwandensis]|uniref:Uncharacterized protein n=1 Tax=Pantoea rwandensis TaxID=1076550 RepID=A0A1X1CP12_9GAMM|nr:hypothetical protein HA51_23930 [Pantoea rwandensis]